VLTPVGSLNGLTYLYQGVLGGNPAAYMNLHSNQYMRRAIAEQADSPTIAFSSSDHFGPHGERVSSGGRGYLLSMMLAVLADHGNRGNSLEEALAYLGRSAAADGTHPRGTVYYVENDNIRSKTRDRAFPAAVEQLEKLGVKAEILNGVVPRDKSDCQGVMLGTADFDWKASGSTILPGAICDHLTSCGGMMQANAGQTPLTEFLRYGAAGASGTVTEPYALQEKFPFPMIHVHYARGCSLAEAFYQSVYGPYQLLVVGDPLCRPWASIPEVQLDAPKPGATLSGSVTLHPTATVAAGEAVDRFELFVDGRRMAQARPGEPLTLDTARLQDGHHELRVVAIAASPIRSQGRQVISVLTANHGRTIEATAAPQGRVPSAGSITVTTHSPGSMAVIILQNSRAVGRIAGEQGQAVISAATLGRGPVRLYAVGLGRGGPETHVLSAPLDFVVD